MIPLTGNRAKDLTGKALPCLCLLGSLLFLSACAGTGSPTVDNPASKGVFNTANPVAPVDRTMVNDLSAVVVQIFDPFDTTLQVTRNNNDPIMQYFIGVLAKQGFGIQRVSADQGAHYLTYERKTTDADNGLLFTISVGPVVASRHYQLIENNVISPTSVVQLAGTRVPVTVVDAPSGRFKVSNPDLSRAEYIATMSLDEQAPLISLITPDVVSRVTTGSTTGPSLQAVNSSKMEVTNLFYGDDSNFASILDDHQRVDRQVIVFGDDSMVLGDTNKQLIDQFVDDKLGQNDVISLVGCSNGPTALEIGNEGLALGRAKRVTEALMSRGVARERILDEGCWAPVRAGDRFPSRGVVMELWRAQS